ncbi:ABC transporter ATP-binding protein [Sporosarcina psychrophila]|uniref:ABC transporter ATP-binding protein n=1 Tax=Sporosarcina psychrophila TaxID=1476 RepID=UPI00078DCB20|nr:dipeptide/oligopeptide/nickel ABC transporter ATP-binding protein [Sporosarcina psychrophila]AMQ08244.1 peptide ABC transporter ATP-binding protein [Sporosarcina psychrophila]
MFVNVENVSKSYNKDGGFFIKSKTEVLSDISLQIKKGECLGLIGESGSGKSTLSKIILGLEKPGRGRVMIEGEPFSRWIKKNKGKMSVVFQDYTSSVNPQFTTRSIIAEPLIALGDNKNLDERIAELLSRVGLPLTMIHKYPHELSGGQLQRVCIARAIATKPKFIVLDEAISSLDVSSQAEILQLLRDIKDDMNMTYLFITHDLQVVANICNRILFLYQGEIVEELESSNLLLAKNDYAKRLLNSVMLFNVP